MNSNPKLPKFDSQYEKHNFMRSQTPYTPGLRYEYDAYALQRYPTAELTSQTSNSNIIGYESNAARSRQGANMVDSQNTPTDNRSQCMVIGKGGYMMVKSSSNNLTEVQGEKQTIECYG